MARQLKTVLHGHQELLPLMARAQTLSTLQQHFISVAPPHLAQAGRVQILGMQLGILSVAVANAAVAAKLRQLAPEMTIRLQEKGCEVSGIRVKVQVSYDRFQPKPKPHQLSQSARTTLNAFSLDLKDSPLKVALQKLVKSKIR